MTQPLLVISTNQKSKLRKRVAFSWILVLIICCFSKVGLAQITSAGTGSWSATTTWVGGVVPGAGANVIIATGHTVTVSTNTAVVGNVTVNAGAVLTVSAAVGSTLSYNGNLVVAGRLNNYGGIDQTSTNQLKSFQMTGTGTYEHNPINNTAQDERIFSRSTESFASTSTLIIKKWFDLYLPLGDATRVNGNFGNVILNLSDVAIWEQFDEFMDNVNSLQRVFGKLTVSSGTIRMCDGSSNGGTGSNYMEFEEVEINGTGNIIFASGVSRALTLVTTNFTDISTSTNTTVVMDSIYNILNWTVNGNLLLGHNFRGMRGAFYSASGLVQMNLNVNGNMTIQGNTLTDIRLVNGVNAPLTVNVTGTTTIGNTSVAGAPAVVRFVDGCNGNFNFTTLDLIISGGVDNTFMGGNALIPNYTGQPNITITRDLLVNGTSNTTILNGSTNIKKLRLSIGDDFIITGANSNFTLARSKGDLTLSVVDSLSMSAGKFIGQFDTLNTSIDSVIVGKFYMTNTSTTDYFRINYGSGNTFFRSNGVFNLSTLATGSGFGFVGIYSGSGNMNFYTGGIFTQTSGRFAGIYNNRSSIITGSLTFNAATNFNFNSSTGASFFRGIENRVTDNSGIVTFNTGNFTYGGGNFAGYYSVHTSGLTSTFTASGLMQITFANATTDTCAFIGVSQGAAAVSNMKLTVNVGGNFTITGPAGLFISNMAKGRETINITGSANISGGKNFFNAISTSALTAHFVDINIGTDMQVFGGVTALSGGNDTVDVSIGGNFSMSLGELAIQYGNKYALMNILGGFNMSGGTLFLHKNATEIALEQVDVNINSDDNLVGDFSHTGGTINFENNATASKQNFLNILSPSITYGGSGIMTSANPGTGTVSGKIKYDRTGTSNFFRTATTHSIQQIQQDIMPSCTLVVASGNLQISSLSNITTNQLYLNPGAVLDLQSNQVISNGLQINSGMTLGGRVRTSRVQGFYDGTTAAAINAYSGANATGVNYLFLSNSTVEYYGVDNQIVTGIGVGIATSAAHKYYNLDINFQGTPNTEFAFPTNFPNSRSVYVRNKLTLTAGELNLDSDRNPGNGGGRSIIIERDSLTAIARVNGYIRSESYDSSASVLWRVNSRLGTRVIPFGNSSTEYIPFTFNMTGGTCDTLIMSTYRTPTNNNLPLPPGIPNVNSLAGTDNSLNTVDRFWYLKTIGSNVVADMTFTCTASELGTVANPRAQCYVPPNLGWTYPIIGTQSTLSNGTFVLGANYMPQNWWTLAGQLSPLPIELMSFNANCESGNVVLSWTTATEKNNDYFTLLRSIDGVNFESIGNVNGSGNSTTAISYEFIDRTSNGLSYYYKLSQTDFDGTESTFGPIRSTPCSLNGILTANAYQTGQDEISVMIGNPAESQVSVKLFSLDGKLIMVHDQAYPQGEHLIRMNTSSLATGIYVVRVQSGQETVSIKTALRTLR
ncbi:MAG: T9SS type A sorting domain-containing protein [Arcticibacter sp.]